MPVFIQSFSMEGRSRCHLLAAATWCIDRCLASAAFKCLRCRS